MSAGDNTINIKFVKGRRKESRFKSEYDETNNFDVAFITMDPYIIDTIIMENVDILNKSVIIIDMSEVRKYHRCVRKHARVKETTISDVTLTEI